MNEYYKHEIFKYAIKMAMEHGQEIHLDDTTIDHDTATIGTLITNQTKEKTMTLFTTTPTPDQQNDDEDDDYE